MEIWIIKFASKFIRSAMPLSGTDSTPNLRLYEGDHFSSFGQIVLVSYISDPTKLQEGRNSRRPKFKGGPKFQWSWFLTLHLIMILVTGLVIILLLFFMMYRWIWKLSLSYERTFLSFPLVGFAQTVCLISVSLVSLFHGYFTVFSCLLVAAWMILKLMLCETNV